VRAGELGAGGAIALIMPAAHVKSRCVGYQQRLHLVRLSERAAVLEDTFSLPEDQQLLSSSAGDGLLFATLGRDAQRDGAIAKNPACAGRCSLGPRPVTLLVLSGFERGHFQIGMLGKSTGSASAAWSGEWGAPQVHANGRSALVFGQGEAAMIDARDAAELELVRSLPLVAAPLSVDLHDEYALVGLGDQGVQRLDLTER